MPTDIKKYTFKNKSKLQLEVVSLEVLTKTNKELLIIPHRTDFYHAFLLENCSPAHIVDFSPVKSKPYTLLFLGKDRVHQFDKVLNYKGHVLIFTDNFFCTSGADTKFLRSTILFNDLVDKPNIQLSKSSFQRFDNIRSEISEEINLGTDQSNSDILKNLLHNFLLLADREKRKQGFSEIKKGPDSDYVLAFKDLADKHFTNLKSVSAYSGKLHISEKRLGQATSKVLGKTPKEIIDDRVLLEAKRLLVHGNQSIKEIGFQLGFEENTNFIKYFRKHTAKTPVEFRESYLS
jgi:AraC family transcriptional activator of pobA